MIVIMAIQPIVLDSIFKRINKICKYYHIIMQRTFKCAAHNDEPLDSVCMSQNCENNGLICYLCRIEDHSDHQNIISFKILLGDFLDQNHSSKHFVKETSQIDRELINIKDRLINLKKRCVMFDLILEVFQKFWKQFLNEVGRFEEIGQSLKQILRRDNENAVKQLNQWIKLNGNKYNESKDEEQKQEQKKDCLKAISDKIQDLQKKNTFDDTELLQLFTIQESRPLKSFRLKFSEELKGTCMTISATNKASMTVHGNQRMILLEPNLGLNRKIKKWRVKIEKLASWIGVGVAHLTSIKDMNFDFSYTAANHGNYLISSNGYSWNGYKMEFNSKFQPFQFTTGDVVEVTYDPNNNKVSFKKQGNEATFSYDVDPTQKPIHAAINMTGVGDAVQIVQ